MWAEIIGERRRDLSKPMNFYLVASRRAARPWNAETTAGPGAAADLREGKESHIT